MSIFSLREFIDRIPACASSITVIEVLSLFQSSQCRHLVLLDSAGYPQGLISSHSVVHGLLNEGFPGFAQLPEPSLMPSRWLRPMQQVMREIEPAPGDVWVEPLLVVSEQDSFETVVARLQVGVTTPMALVDTSRQYLGLIDPLRLWQAIALSSADVALASNAAPVADSDRWLAHHCQSTQLQQTTLEPLLSLLKQVPLPMMLQTSQGRMIMQNPKWQQQVTEIRDPQAVRSRASDYFSFPPDLENQTENHSHPPLRQPSSTAFSQQPLMPPGVNQGLDHAMVDVADPEPAPYCYNGGEDNACICICPLKGGQERIWQFVRVPLGTLAAMAGCPTPSLAQPFSSEQTSAAFQLAALDNSFHCFGVESQTQDLPEDEELWLVLAQDITEQHHVTKELAAKNADLLQLNRLKDEFLACISHELKTPLTAVLGLSSLLKDQQLGALNERQLRYAQLIYQSGRHLILIVNDILDLTRIETGQLDLVLESVPIEKVCQRAYKQARQMLSPEDAADSSCLERNNVLSSIKFSLKIEPQLEWIVADEIRLRQMLANLLSNALKFTPANGEVGLTVDHWDEWIAFTIWDTGIGIPAEKQHLIFQKFQQLENPLTRQFEGTGLGLFLTQRLAHLHGGDVTFTSVEHHGSQFTLLLPPSPPDSQLPREKAPSQLHKLPQKAQVQTNRLLMVVEGVPHVLQEVTDLIGQLGYRTAIARSGTEALEKIRRLQPSVVLLNPIVPLLSGWDVLTLLKSDEETRHIPVVVMASSSERNAAYGHGAEGFLATPLQPDALKHQLDQHIQLDQPAPEQPFEPTVLHIRLTSPLIPIGLDHLDLVPFANEVDATSTSDSVNLDLNALLYPNHCRVIEVDDLEQANLLGRVWKPDVMLLDGWVADPVDYLQQLVQYPYLATLPIVTLTSDMTRAANQITGLGVFPCLDYSTESPSDATILSRSSLFQVIQVAAGMNCLRHILLVDLTQVLANPPDLSYTDHDLSHTDSSAANRSAHCFKALTHYLELSGYRGLVVNSWHEILHTLQHRGTDLMLLYLHDVVDLSQVANTLHELCCQDFLPPILVWDARTAHGNVGHPIENELEAIATIKISATVSIQELVETIRSLLTA